MSGTNRALKFIARQRVIYDQSFNNQKQRNEDEKTYTSTSK